MGKLQVQMKNVATRGERLYYRRKVAGKDVLIRLPALDDPNFAAEYARLSASKEPVKGVTPGSFAALAIEFRASLAKRKLAPKTRENYLRYVQRIEDDIGERSVRGIRPAHVYALRNHMSATPGVANNYVSVLRLMLAYACELDWTSSNAAASIPALRLGEHQPWPASVLEAALTKASPMTRLAIITALCSGQRIGDIIKMQHGWCKHGIIELIQRKTGKHVAVPMHPLWLAELSKHERKAVTLLYDRSGRPFQSEATLRERVGDLLTSIGAEQYTFHGLRKNAACYLAEAGLTDEQIGALTGMSPDMVRLYTRRVNVWKIAESVAARLAGGTPVPAKGELS
jgi:integrase